MTDVEERAIATLKEILTLWQNIKKKFTIGHDGAVKMLDGYLDPSFYEIYRTPPGEDTDWPRLGTIDDFVKIDKVEELPDGRVSVAYTNRPHKAPWHRAMFVKQDNGRLLLQSGMMLCPACFGDGKDHDGGPCILCDGEGWEQ